MCPLLLKILLGSPSAGTAQERGKSGSLNECGTSPSLSLSLYNCKCVQLCLDGKQQYSEEWRDEGKTHVRVISSSLSVSYELSFFLSFSRCCIEVTKNGMVSWGETEEIWIQHPSEAFGRNLFILVTSKIACDYYYYPSSGALLSATFKHCWRAAWILWETDYSINWEKESDAHSWHHIRHINNLLAVQIFLPV